MGFKNLFTRKKKLVPSTTGTPIMSRSPSLSSHQSSIQLAAELEQVFKKFDVNGDGKISASELGSIRASLGEPTSKEELISIIKGVDSNSDGCINLDEFIELHTVSDGMVDFEEFKVMMMMGSCHDSINRVKPEE